MPIGLTEWDQESLDACNQEPNPNVYEFDLTLWFVLSGLCKNSPGDAAAIFGLPGTTIQALAKATKTQLSLVSSGVLISFNLATPESAVLEFLSSEYVPVIRVSDSHGGEFDTAYWLLLKSVGIQYTPAVAATIFNVSIDLARAVISATDNQLRHIAESTVTAFSLRFCTDLIPDLMGLNSYETSLPHRYLQKYQQSISSPSIRAAE